MPSTKPFWQSKTYWGLFVTLFGVLVQIGVPFPAPIHEFMNDQFVDIASQTAIFVGLVLAAIGRNTAKTKIRIK